MSQFQIPIPGAIRQRMTIQPPLPYTADGVLLRASDGETVRYEDMRMMKQMVTVRIEEELESRDSLTLAGSPSYVLGIVCMSNEADLEVVLSAARHLGLLSRYEIVRTYKEALDDRYEKNYIEVRLECGEEMLAVAEDVLDGSPVRETVPLMVSLGERRQIWLGLFEAAGYRVQWGGTLNVRKTHL